MTDKEIIATLAKVTTATLTTLLLKKGLRNVWMRGTKPISPGYPRIVGKAFTLRFVPAREDLATPESWSKPISTRGIQDKIDDRLDRTALGLTPSGTTDETAVADETTTEGAQG